MTHLPAPHRITRRSFCTLSAVALASLALPARRAFGDEAATAATATQPGAIVIVHTNDVHCAVDDNLGYAKLVNYAKTMRSTYGADNVTLVDAGDAVQGKAMGTLTDGEYLVDIMNECGYDFAIPGNHEFDYGMAQFNTLVARANAKYLSCNFTDLRTGNLMFDAYAMREYGTGADTKKVAFLGICTPESLTKSSPAHFQEGGTYRYGFCEDDSGAKLYDAVQRAVDQARADGADYVVALAHLGQGGVTPRWTSAAVAANTSGIDVIIDGHSHELYVQTPLNKNGQPVLVTQTGTQLVGIGQVVINPATGTIAAYASDGTETVTASTTNGTASIIKAWDGVDADTAACIAGLQADLAKITGRVIGRSDVRLVALEDDDYTWAVRAHETNLGDFVADAYLALAWHGGIMADIGLVNGGGIRANIEPGDVTYGNLIDVQPFNNQLAYVDTLGQNILDALEVGASKLPEPIFTPSTKAEIGDHDENISYERLVEIIGEDDASQLRDLALKVYTTARDHAAERGVIIADTKFEFGRLNGQIILADEVLTPDSSRFWPGDEYAEGKDQPSFDKQFVRDWLNANWDRQGNLPRLPQDIIDRTSEKYIQAYEKITGRTFVPFA